VTPERALIRSNHELPRRVWSFTELAADFVFYTPALLHTHGGCDRELHSLSHGSPCQIRNLVPAAAMASRPVIACLPDSQLYQRTVVWSRFFYLVPRDQWPGFRDYIGSVAIMHPQTGETIRVAWQDVTIYDPFWSGPGDRLVSIMSCCLYSDRRFCSLTGGPTPDSFRVSVGPPIVIPVEAPVSGSENQPAPPSVSGDPGS
jgi:hypothetical protein